MIPKFKRRKIIVDGNEWEYCITGKWEPSVFIHNIASNEKIDWNINCECVIKPKDIRTLIEKKELWGIKAGSNK